jgi:hypothetical protein
MSLHHQAIRRQAFLAALNFSLAMTGGDAVTSVFDAAPGTLGAFPEPGPDTLMWVSSSISEPFLTISPREAVDIRP